jgi:hypothetical protein
MNDSGITASVMMAMMPGDGSDHADDMYDSMVDIKKQEIFHYRQLQQQQQQEEMQQQPANSASSHVTSSSACPSTTTPQRLPFVLKPHRDTTSMRTVASTSIRSKPSMASAVSASYESEPTPTTKSVTSMISPEETCNHNYHQQHSIVPTNKRSISDGISQNNNNNSNNAIIRKKACRCKSTVIYFLFGVAITMTVVAVGICVPLYFDRQQDNVAAAKATGSPASSTHVFSRPPSTTSGQENDPWLEMFPPSVSPNVTSPSQSSDDEIAAMITDIVTNQFRVELPNDDPMTPINRAVQWLIEEAQDYHNQNTTQVYHALEKFSQRFAVLVLYYALTTALTTSSSTLSSSACTSVVNTTMGDIPQRGLDECEWVGVKCSNSDDDDNDEMISQIDFSDCEFSGTIPPEVKLLPKLVQLDLSNNRLQGSLPEELYGLTLMKRVYLYQNQLSGTLSPSISQWERLEVLHLSHNRLKGPIPPELQQPDEEGFRPLRKFGRGVQKYWQLFLGTFIVVGSL